jgi:hypothetical protein
MLLFACRVLFIVKGKIKQTAQYWILVQGFPGASKITAGSRFVVVCPESDVPPFGKEYVYVWKWYGDWVIAERVIRLISRPLVPAM